MDKSRGLHLVPLSPHTLNRCQNRKKTHMAHHPTHHHCQPKTTMSTVTNGHEVINTMEYTTIGVL